MGYQVVRWPDPDRQGQVTIDGGGVVTREKTRIYVGGLGGAVTEDDLRKTFSALGEVVAVDVVRTKGRSFAYLDFLPSTDKSLPKLFSTYNGCMWKGGKLRLEKAKEHYLLRLRGEWQEESENASKASDSCNTAPSESHDTLEKPKRPALADKTQLRIFFPKLQKVKSLAQVGIGKHKYSFQRIQVPSIPTHFCDCEEHSPAFLPTDRKQASELENASDGINEQELDIMNSVMNNIFARANPSKQETRKSDLLNEAGISVKSNDELPAVADDEEDHLTDEDNLIINVASGSDGMDLLGEMRTMMAKQEPVAKRKFAPSEKPKRVDDSRKKNTVSLNKKRKSPHIEKNDGGDSVIPKTSRNSKIRLGTHESNNKTEAEPGIRQSGTNSLRSLKSTWKDLIGQKGNTPFSISDILASVPQEKDKKFKGDDPEKNSVRNKKRKSVGDENEFPETTSSKLDLDKEPTTEVGAVITEISIPDIFADDSQQKIEESRVDLDVPLPTITLKTNESDVLPGASEQKEEPPRTDGLENGDNQSGNSKDPVKRDEDLIRTARGESWRHKSSWTQLISTISHTSFSISQIVPDISSEKTEQQADTFNSQPENKNLNTSAAAAAAAAPIKDQIPAGMVTEATEEEHFRTQEKFIFRELGIRRNMPVHEDGRVYERVEEGKSLSKRIAEQKEKAS